MLVQLLLCFLAFASSKDVPIATFDGTKPTTLHWETVNDPVMGGQSTSEFHLDETRQLGIWKGEVRVVPFLHAPGFCSLQSPGLYKTAELPDIAGTDGVVVKVRAASNAGLTNFSIMLKSKGAKHFMQEGSYMAPFVVSSEMEEHFVPWSAFSCSVRGQPVSWCPKLDTQLSQITGVGLSTFFPGKAGSFELELDSVSARSLHVDDAASFIDLATFDGGSAQHTWHTENDPVMGGRSSSAFKVVDGVGDYSGTCRIVPSLQAPGFTIVMTESPLFGKFPDVSSFDGIALAVRNAGGNVTNFKFAFCDSHINLYRCQFGSFKADFSVAQSEGTDFTEVFLPWNKFSDKWSEATGKHTAENPPTAASLKAISQLQVWTEGVAGDFHLQIKYIRAAQSMRATTDVMV
eukprot:TRINITY_DN66217_c0_g1_i1.p1 TRINITY_DN66217_c0_g1~~TRINITY_DN66217_c0_g1_i1.p1  ORF type:complete len:404 (-),score=47.40 TRINITY_DN66217_c0_g1_i1:102-1313(-)